MKKIVMVAATVVLTMTSTVLISCVDNIDNLRRSRKRTSTTRPTTP